MLSANVLLITVSVPPAFRTVPGSSIAELPEKVLLVMVRLPLLLMVGPREWFPEKVLLLMVKVPSLSIAPAPLARLPLKVLFMIVSDPALDTAPGSAGSREWFPVKVLLVTVSVPLFAEGPLPGPMVLLLRVSVP
jgi:hypothetical protein